MKMDVFEMITASEAVYALVAQLDRAHGYEP